MGNIITDCFSFWTSNDKKTSKKIFDQRHPEIDLNNSVIAIKPENENSLLLTIDPNKQGALDLVNEILCSNIFNMKREYMIEHNKEIDSSFLYQVNVLKPYNQIKVTGNIRAVYECLKDNELCTNKLLPEEFESPLLQQ